jgi:hypothetical protein
MGWPQGGEMEYPGRPTEEYMLMNQNYSNPNQQRIMDNLTAMNNREQWMREYPDQAFIVKPFFLKNQRILILLRTVLVGILMGNLITNLALIISWPGITKIE